MRRWTKLTVLFPPQPAHSNAVIAITASAITTGLREGLPTPRCVRLVERVFI
jgi:hypothetical protein